MTTISVNNESDDEFGPQLVSHDSPKQKKRRIASDWERHHLENLPSAQFYEHSYMHRDVVTHICVSKATEFIITGSQDGHVKFWKKMTKGIEFVKHYQAHLGAINAMEISVDEKQLVTTSSDQMIKFFEIVGFDMSNMIAVNYCPTAAVWLNDIVSNRVGVADKNCSKIRIYSATGTSDPLHEVCIHNHPVSFMALNAVASTVISVDAKGMIEYWNTSTYLMPSIPTISYKYKTETGLYDLAKSRTSPCSLTVASRGRYFATFSRDKQIRLFEFSSGKLLLKYDESVDVYSSENTQYDELELGRKKALERELESNVDNLSKCNIVFDESNLFLLFATLRGIKVISIDTNRVVRVIGLKEKAERFLCLALYQGIPIVDQQLLLSRQESASGSNSSSSIQKTSEEILEETNQPDPTIFCASFKRRRFYCFSNREPDESNELRDKFNELPTEEERVQTIEQTKSTLPTEAILHTTFGDIVIKLFSLECPKTVENFATHISNNYYDNIIFHRVIKGFMIQTGDPLGDGTGGESIWGKEFEDEFVRTLRHDRPFTVSMANAGPNTNGSQFFITTVPTPWLDNKHTVFGRVVKGFEVVTKIENLKVNKIDKPIESVKIISAETH